MTGPTRAELVLYGFCRGAVVGFCRLYWRTRVDGRGLLPDGPFILSPVHRSNIDTPLVGAVTRRRLRYMGKHSMWKHKLPGRLFTALGSFPVKRGTADRVAMRQCLEVLERAGEPLVVFPEGTRRSGPVVEDLEEGAAYLALRAGVPIVPVGIGGSERAMTKGSWMLRPVRTHLVIGPPIVPEAPADGGRVPRRAVRELTEQLRVELQRLFDEAQARAGA